MSTTPIFVLAVSAGAGRRARLGQQLRNAAPRLALAGVARNADEAVHVLHNNPDCVVVLGLRDGNGVSRRTIARLLDAGCRALIAQGKGDRIRRLRLAELGVAALVDRDAPDEWLHAAIENAHAFHTAPALRRRATSRRRHQTAAFSVP